LILQGVDLLMDLLMKSNYIVSIIGAGISTNAGIPDFRGPKGIYTRGISEKVFDIDYFKKDPTFFYENTSELLPIILEAKPTKGHLFLKKLEDLGKLKMTISQNVDGLHKKAGIKNYIDIHGNFDKFICINCLKEYDTNDSIISLIKDYKNNKIIPKCELCNGVLKPNVVFFGEPVKGLELALTEVQKSDLLITIGTSLKVYPVAQLPSYISDNAKLVIINQTETDYDHKAKLVLHDDIDNIVEKLKIY